jgi:putative sigma-54 modulation protein
VQIKISARHGHLADDTQQFIREKAQKLVRIFERLTSIEITVDLSSQGQDGQHLVEFIAKSEHKHDFIAHERHSDILAAVDLVMNKLENQVRRHKEKIQDHRRTPAMGDVKEPPTEA